MKRIVPDLQCAMFADAITMALERSDPDFLVLRSDAPGKTAAPSPRLRWRAAMWSFKRAARAKFTTGCPST